MLWILAACNILVLYRIEFGVPAMLAHHPEFCLPPLPFRKGSLSGNMRTLVAYHQVMPKDTPLILVVHHTVPHWRHGPAPTVVALISAERGSQWRVSLKQ
jgi:hypothetical protein